MNNRLNWGDQRIIVVDARNGQQERQTQWPLNFQFFSAKPCVLCVVVINIRVNALTPKRKARKVNAEIKTRPHVTPHGLVLGIYCPRLRSFATTKHMNHRDLLNEIVSTYQKHGWQLQRVLLRPETRAELNTELTSGSLQSGAIQLEQAEVDALWFSRPSHQQREAWELRLLAENPFALFEVFEADEPEELREDMRREMEARLRAYANK